MIRLVQIACILLPAFCATQALADQFVTANDLLEFCKSYPASASAYVAGATDTMMIAQNNKFIPMQFCLRPSVTAGQLTDIVCRYTQGFPDLRDAPGATYVSLALSQAFPCR